MNTKAMVAEFVGTFTLVFIGAGVVAQNGGLVAAALAHGLVLMAFVYAIGSISGAHVNPAVTFGALLAGEMTATDAVAWWVAQILGGVAGAGALAYVLGGTESNLGATQLAEGVSVSRGLVLEGILTFFLVTMVLNTAVAGRGGNGAGAAIGLTLAFAILMGGPLTGASLNPARTLGPAVLTGGLDQFWVYLVGTFAGAAVAAGLYKGVLAD
ncbi:MAG: MIP/aquaporin family protein [Anaerolineae bacterium]